MRRWLALALVLMLVAGFGLVVTTGQPDHGPEGVWEAWLDSPGGRIGFELEITPAAAGGLSATLHDGESIPIPVTTFDGATLVLDFVHYDSRLQASWDRQRQLLDGTWTKRTGPEAWAKLPFHAVRAPQPGGRTANVSALPADLVSVAGRWAVQFSDSDAPAVGIFVQAADSLHGTFLTVSGDYRYLHGTMTAGGELQLQCFDGAHAFLFKAELRPDGTLAGDFWSRDASHVTWTARREPEAALPDPMQLNLWNESVSLAELAYPDPAGKSRSLADPAFAGKARIIEVFGTWCPNCNDATRYLMELDRKYRSRGLAILGLAFEVSGDFERDAAQVRRYIEHHGLQYPILVAGKSDKQAASAAFPALDRVQAFPTTIFLDATGRVRRIYTGYSGPATGEAHAALRRQFETLIEELLAEP